MISDWGHFLESARTKPNHQLELEAEIPDHLGGSAQMRAVAKTEIKRRNREAAEKLLLKQLAIAEKQAQSAKWAVLAAWGSAGATILAGILTFAVSLWQAYL